MAAPNIEIGVVTLHGANSTTKNFEVAGFGTPKACLVFAVHHGAADGVWDDTPTDLALSAGAYDGTNERCAAVVVQDDTGAGNPGRYMNTDCCVAIAGRGVSSPSVKGTATGWSTDGVTISFNADATEVEIIVVLMKGTDLSASVGTHTPGTTNGSTATTNVGFDPHLVFLGTNGSTMSASGAGFALFSVGAAHNGSGGITNRGICYRGSDTGDTIGDPELTVETDEAGGQLDGGSFTWSVEVTSFPANSFRTTTAGSTGSDEMWYLALASANDQDDFKLFTIDGSTSTGNQSFITTWDVPQAVFGVHTSLQNLDTITEDASAGGMSFFATDGTAEAYSAAYEEDANPQIYAASKHDDAYVLHIGQVSSSAGTTFGTASHVSFDSSGGWTVNWDVSHTFTTYGFGIAVKGSDAAGAGVGMIDRGFGRGAMRGTMRGTV